VAKIDRALIHLEATIKVTGWRKMRHLSHSRSSRRAVPTNLAEFA